MTRAEAVAHLRTLGTVAVWNLAVPAVIRPCRDGWLIFLPGEGHAWYGTAEAGRTRCSPESTAVAYRPDSADQALCDKGLVPVLRARAVTCQRSRPPAPRACTATPSRWPRRRHGPVTRPSVW